MNTLGPLVGDRNMVYLPVEIIGEIFHYLRTDKSSLWNCALVCKSWTPSCRRHIFYHVGFKYSAEFRRWCRSVSAAPNGPHLHTRKLVINDHFFSDSGGDQSPNQSTLFLQHFTLFSNVQDLVIHSSYSYQTFDNLSVPEVFGHLSGTLRYLSIQGASCSPPAMISLVASFQHLDHLELLWTWFHNSESLRPTPERLTFKGILSFTDWLASSEEFVRLLADHDLQYREVYVSGEHWLQDTVWNRCLAKCADRLKRFGINLSKNLKFLRDREYKMLAFKNLRGLSLQSSSERTATLPPPEFLSSITSKQLSEIVIDIAVSPPCEEFNQALDALRGYDKALCQLSNRLEPYSGREKLVLTLQVADPLFVPDAILPRFSETGVLEVVKPGTYKHEIGQHFMT